MSDNVAQASGMIKKICLLLMLLAASRPTTAPTTAPALRQVHVLISGKVQGVGFRAFTEQKANELAVKGWVRNLRDGRVESIMQGAPPAVEKLLQSVKSGPTSARVDALEVKEEKIGQKFPDFKVLPTP